jgi:hypothetical protein
MNRSPGSCDQFVYFLPLTFCVSAEAATVFTLAGVFGLESSLEAAVATRDDVVSFGFVVAMLAIPYRKSVQRMAAWTGPTTVP